LPHRGAFADDAERTGRWNPKEGTGAWDARPFTGYSGRGRGDLGNRTGVAAVIESNLGDWDMPALDTIHEVVRQALLKEDWTITDDPLTLDFYELVVYADLGAEKTLGARRGGERRAIEIKSFSSNLPFGEFKLALGQYLIYRAMLERLEPDRSIHLAVPEAVFNGFVQRQAVQFIVQRYEVRILVVDIEKAEVVQWTS
jgi:hypothetical protein